MYTILLLCRYFFQYFVELCKTSFYNKCKDGVIMLAFLERIILSTKFWSVVMLVVGTIIFYKAIDYSLKNYINKKKKRATLGDC